jgi:hypothetical protein
MRKPKQDERFVIVRTPRDPIRVVETAMREPDEVRSGDFCWRCANWAEIVDLQKKLIAKNISSYIDAPSES